jgi:hypothetical protein
VTLCSLSPDLVHPHLIWAPSSLAGSLHQNLDRSSSPPLPTGLQMCYLVAPCVCKLQSEEAVSINCPSAHQRVHLLG